MYRYQLQGWLPFVPLIYEKEERENVIMGMCAIVSANPQAVLPHFGQVKHYLVLSDSRIYLLHPVFVVHMNLVQPLVSCVHWFAASGCDCKDNKLPS